MPTNTFVSDTPVMNEVADATGIQYPYIRTAPAAIVSIAKEVLGEENRSQPDRALGRSL
jgi:hypothetical protein